jgi:hypothetical protein
MNNGFYKFSQGKQETTSSVFPYTGSAIISGSLQVIGSITGSLFGTSSWANNSISASYSLSSSFATTSSFAISSSQAITSSFAQTASFAPNYLPLTGGTVNGSLTINNNLTVLGSASIQYISESTLNIGTNLITVNTLNPAIRFGGLAVIDSGSSPQVSASFLYDSVQDEFIFVHRGTSTSAITSSHFLLGPETYNDLGNELYLTANRIPKGKGNEHLNDSNISDDGSIVSINSNTQVTGSLNVTQGITGSLFGTSSWANNAISSSQAISSSFAISASWAPSQVVDTGSLVTTSSFNAYTGSNTSQFAGTASFATTASYVENAQSASYVLQAVSSSFAATASFALNAGGGGTSLGTLQAFTLGLQNIF